MVSMPYLPTVYHILIMYTALKDSYSVFRMKQIGCGNTYHGLWWDCAGQAGQEYPWPGPRMNDSKEPLMLIVLWAQLLLTLEVAVLAVAAKDAFGLVLVNGLANKKQFRSASPNQSYHSFALSSLWWRSGYTFNQWPSSPNYSPAFIE